MDNRNMYCFQIRRDDIFGGLITVYTETEEEAWIMVDKILTKPAKHEKIILVKTRPITQEDHDRMVLKGRK